MARQTREIWQNLIKQFERSGKTQEQFATEREIPLTALRAWIYRLKREREGTGFDPAGACDSLDRGFGAEL
jgi:hypothetical protein